MQPRQYPQSKKAADESPITNDVMRIELLFPFQIKTVNDIKEFPKSEFSIDVNLPNGETEKFKMPASTWKQRRWLKKVIKQPLEKKLSTLNGLILKSKSWETYSLLSHLQQTDPKIGQNLSTRSKQLIVDGLTFKMDDWSPISIACGVHDKLLIAMMLTCGADINTIDTPRKKTPIISALSGDTTDENMIQFILSAGATLDESDFKYIKHANTLEYCKNIIATDNSFKALPAPKEENDMTEKIEDTAEIKIDENAPTNANIFSLEKQKIIVKMPNGTTEELTIPAPTADDLKWSRDIINQSEKTILKQATESILENNIWRLLFLLEQSRIHHEPEKLFNIDSYGSKDNDLTLLGHTTYSTNTNNKDVAILLVAYGADIEKGKGRRWTPLINAIANSNQELVELFISNEAYFCNKDIEQYADNTEMMKYFSNEFGNLLIGSQHHNLNDKKQLEENTFVGTKWQQLDENTIAKITYTPNKARLNKIFNFESQELERFTESLNHDREVTAISTSIVQSFNSIAIKDEIKTAHKELCEQGGNPETITTYIRDTRRISKPKNA